MLISKILVSEFETLHHSNVKNVIKLLKQFRNLNQPEIHNKFIIMVILVKFNNNLKRTILMYFQTNCQIMSIKIAKVKEECAF